MEIISDLIQNMAKTGQDPTLFFDEAKEALWKQYTNLPDVAFGSIMERVRAKKAFFEAIDVGMDLQKEISSP